MVPIFCMIYSLWKASVSTNRVKIICLGVIINVMVLVKRSDESELFPPGQLSETFSKGYMDSELTQSFLANLSMDKAYAVMEQLRQCPLVPLCSYSFNIEVPKDAHSCCWKCNCDVNCTQHLDCCPDVTSFDSLLDEPFSAQQKEVCMKTSLKVDLRKGVYGINSCPYNSSDELKQRCDKQHYFQSITFPEIIPVTDLKTGVTYRNRGCAICNGAWEPDLEYWRVSINCATTINLPQFNTDEDVINEIMQNRNRCNIDFTPETFAKSQIRICVVAHVTSCNSTGSWANYKQEYVDMCALYTSPVQVNYKIYKNVFCALCNEERDLSLTCPSPISPSDDLEGTGFSAILAINENVIDTTVDCQPGFIRSPVTDECFKVHCSIMRRLRNNTCELFISSVKGLFYEISYMIRTFKTLSIQTALKIADDLIIKLQKILLPKRFTLDFSDDFAFIMSLIPNTKNNIIVSPLDKLRLYFITFRLRYSSLHNVEELVSFLYRHNFRRFTVGVLRFVAVLRYTRQPRTFITEFGDHVGLHNCILGSELILNATHYIPTFETLKGFYNFNSITNTTELNYVKDISTLKTSSDLCSSGTEFIPIQMLRGCLFTRINFTDMTWIETVDGLYLDYIFAAHPEDYIFDEKKSGDEEAIIACTRILFDLQLNLRNEYTWSSFSQSQDKELTVSSTRDWPKFSQEKSTRVSNENGQNQGCTSHSLVSNNFNPKTADLLSMVISASLTLLPP